MAYTADTGGGRRARRCAAGRRPSAALLGALCCALACVLAWAAPARAQHISLSDLVLDNRAGNITVRFSLDMEDEGELEKILADGAVLSLVCEGSLSAARNWWLDKDVTESRFVNRLRYDALTKEYVLERPGGDAPRRGKDLKELLKRAWAVIEVDLGAFDVLQRGRSYTLDLDVSLKYDDVPAWLRSALFFWSWNVAPSARYRMEFQY
ncbi:MAG: DUF4390 domain-containing protein [Desulfovibrionaceae bacterium]|jgi:hypothetical protein|nr:DUF4390 domain-containing protein [Desulfovibrionaceae bacterium]